MQFKNFSCQATGLSPNDVVEKCKHHIQAVMRVRTKRFAVVHLGWQVSISQLSPIVPILRCIDIGNCFYGEISLSISGDIFERVPVITLLGSSTYNHIRFTCLWSITWYKIYLSTVRKWPNAIHMQARWQNIQVRKASLNKCVFKNTSTDSDLQSPNFQVAFSYMKTEPNRNYIENVLCG